MEKKEIGGEREFYICHHTHTAKSSLFNLMYFEVCFSFKLKIWICLMGLDKLSLNAWSDIWIHRGSNG